MPEAAKLDLILAMLDARDSSLRNMAFKDVETHKRIDQKTKELWVGATTYAHEIRRHDGRVWMHGTITDHEGGRSRASLEFNVNWDGKVSRGLDLLNSTAQFRGSIGSSERGNFGWCFQLFFLGCYMNVNNTLPSVAQWLRDAVQSGAKIDVSSELYNGRDTLHLTVIQDRKREFWFDVQRDFMIIAYRSLLEDGSGSVMEVQDVKRVDGVWIPTRGLRRARTDGSQKFAEVTIELREFSLGTVKPSDVEVTFPRGTGVVDHILQISYVMLPDGRYELHPLVVNETRTVRKPPKNNIVDRIDPTIAASYVAAPLQSGRPGSSPSTLEIALRWLSVGLALLVLVFVLAKWYRAKQINRPPKILGEPAVH
jgi:hypothetical protein